MKKPATRWFTAAVLILQGALLQSTLAQTSPSQVYRWTDSAGVVHYSHEKPPSGAKVITLDTGASGSGMPGSPSGSPGSQQGPIDPKKWVWTTSEGMMPPPGLKPGQLPPGVPAGAELPPGYLPPQSGVPLTMNGEPVTPGAIVTPGGAGSPKPPMSAQPRGTPGSSATNQPPRMGWPQATRTPGGARTISLPYPSEVPARQ
jgi:hypothetical protein